MRPLSRICKRVDEAVVDVAELVLVGDLDVDEVELGGVGGVAAHLLDVLADA